MRIATILLDGQEVGSIITDHGYLPIPFINQRFNKNWPHDVFSILAGERLEEIKRWFYQNSDSLSQELSMVKCMPKIPLPT